MNATATRPNHSTFNLQIPPFHSINLLPNSPLQRLNRLFHPNTPAPSIHRKAQNRKSAQSPSAEIETLAFLREPPDALAGACGILVLGHESGG